MTRVLERVADDMETKARALQASANDMGTVHGEALDRARERRTLALSLLFSAEAIRSALKAEAPE